MSLSDGDALGVMTGRVILGPGTDGGEAETTVSEMESRRSPMHFEEVEAQFWERVRAKAKAKASAIIAEAMAEGERLKAKAQEEGYAAGVAAAGGQIQAELAQMSTSLGSMLESLTAERSKLWTAHRQEFISLLRLAVERTTMAAIDARREEILGNLFNESLELMDAKASLTVVAHPDDEPLVRELIARAAQERGGLDKVLVRTDPQLIPGSLILESPDGLVDNSIGSRFSEVEKIFDQLAASGDDDAGA